MEGWEGEAGVENYYGYFWASCFILRKEKFTCSILHTVHISNYDLNKKCFWSDRNWCVCSNKELDRGSEN